MTPELTRAVFFIIWGAGVVVWALGLRRSLVLLRERQTAGLEWGGPGFPGDEAGAGVFRGEWEVEGRPDGVQAEVSRRLPEALGVTFVLRATANGLELKNTLPPAFRRQGWSNVSQAHLTFQPADLTRTRVSYELDLSLLQRRLGRIALTVVLAAGLPTVVAVGALIWLLVLPSQHPAVRWQVFQTLQVVHGLWPPFMVTAKLKANLQEVESSLRALLEAAGGAVSG